MAQWEIAARTTVELQSKVVTAVFFLPYFTINVQGKVQLGMRRAVSVLFGSAAGLVAIVAAAVPVSSGHAQQQQKPPGTYDGKYAGTMRCVGLPNTRLNGLTIRQSRFVFNFKTNRGAGTLSCTVQIKSDGTFDNQSCDLPMSGKVTGDTFQASFKSTEALCDVTATREKN